MQSNRSNKTRRLGSRPSILVLMVFCGLVTSVCAVMQGVPLPDIPAPAAPAATKAPPGPTAPPEPTSPNVSKAEPSATSLWSGGTEQAGSVTRQPAYFFSEEDCGCATFPGEVEPSYGPGYLECNYRWNGKYIDDNHASFILQQYDDPVELTQVFNEHVGWSYDSADEDRKFIDSGSLPDDEQYIIRNDPNGFNYVTTGPGGGSSKV